MTPDLPHPLPISRSAVVRSLDRRLIEGAGIASPILMEHAGHLVADAIRACWADHRRAVVLCGPGNNGGDGYVIARHLRIAGWSVVAVPVLPPASEECRLHHRICERLGLIAPPVDLPALLSPPPAARLSAPAPLPPICVDALYGTGQRAPLTLPPIPPIPGPLVAVDVPTGLDADTGARTGDFPLPDLVVCIGRLKPFLFHHALPWRLVDIGLDLPGPDLPAPDLPPLPPPEAYLCPPESPWPVPPLANKWDRGRLSILAGSAQYPGAAVLCALGALRGGAGLITLHAPAAALPRLGALPPEIMLADAPAPGAPFPPPCDALVIGPGLGRAQDDLIRRLWAGFPGPMVVDADAIRALPPRPAPPPHPRLLTPHAGEAAHLLDLPWRDLEADRLAAARRLAEIAPAIHKGAHPIVACPGAPLTVFHGALPQLGVGGSGDVLAGLCGALAARARPTDAAGMARVAAQAVSRQITAARGVPLSAGLAGVLDRL